MIITVTLNEEETILHYRIDRADTRILRTWANAKNTLIQAAARHALQRGLASLARESTRNHLAAAGQAPSTESL